METLAATRRALAAVDLVEGLAPEEALNRFGQALRCGDAGHYGQAFFAADLFAQSASLAWGHRSLFQLLESRFKLERRRTAELVRVGTRLRDLPLIDKAFREDDLRWSDVLLLVRVASPEHEEAWLELAQERSPAELKNEVKMAVPGGPPRKPGQRRGVHEIHKRHSFTVGTVDDETIATAKRKLSAQLDRKVGEAEFVATLADLFLRMEEDGPLPGHKRVDASLYRIVLRPEHVHEEDRGCGKGHEHHDHPPLTLHCDLGHVPVLDEVLEACIHCDAETHTFDAHGNPLLDPKTDKTLRKKVLIRDGFRCRCCGSPYRLHVHHIQFRSKHGKTKAFNLVVMCLDCHSLVHAGLLFLDGHDASDIVFVDRKGRPLNQRGERVDPSILLALSAPTRAKGRDCRRVGAVNPFVPPVTLASIPPAVDGTWWRRHAPLIHGSRGQGLRFQPGHPLPAEEEVAEGDVEEARADGAKAKAGAFDGLVGQQALLHRLLVAVDATRLQGRAFPHTLFVGPPGTGKTTLARGVATALDAHLIPTSGPLLQNAHDLLVLLAQLREGDVFFIDEVHAVPRQVLEVLYQAMAEGGVDLTFHARSQSRTTRLELPAFTLLAATTEEAEVPEALRSRFGIREVLGYYDEADIADLVTRRARERQVFFRTGAADVVARAARGTPREALRLLDRVLDEFCVRHETTPDVAAVHAALGTLGYDERGLDARDQRYLALLEGNNAPVSLTRILGALGTDERTLLRNVEPHLFRLGLVVMTPHGRQVAGRVQTADGQVSNLPNERHVTEWPRQSRGHPERAKRVERGDGRPPPPSV